MLVLLSVSLLVLLCFLYWFCLIRCHAAVSLNNVSILITGCDVGVGRALAEQCHNEGMIVFATCLTVQAVQELSSKSNLYALQLDVTSDESVAAAVHKVDKIVGERGLDIVLNNAAILESFLVEFTPLSVYERVLHVNFLGTVRVCQFMLPLLRRAVEYKKKNVQSTHTSAYPAARIINITSFLSRLPFLTLSAYCASKAATASFTTSLRQEMKYFGIDVVTIEPGCMSTGMKRAMTQLMSDLWQGKGAAAESNERVEQLRCDYGDGWIATIQRADLVMNFTAHEVQRLIDSFMRAIREIKPLTHYFCGWDSHVYAILAHLPIPASLTDLVICKVSAMPTRKSKST